MQEHLHFAGGDPCPHSSADRDPGLHRVQGEAPRDHRELGEAQEPAGVVQHRPHRA